MSFQFGRRMAMVATTAALGVGALITAAGSASASDYVPIDTGHSVGLYHGPSTDSGKPGFADIPPGGEINAQCWTVGQSIGSYGDTWYRTDNVNWDNGTGWWSLNQDVYVFAGYADGNAHSVNRDPSIPEC